jgi:hypothetical protein
MPVRKEPALPVTSDNGCSMNQTTETRPALTPARMEEVLLKIARECIEEGPGYAQEMIALRQAAEDLNIGDDLKEQQRLLTVWQNLFRTGQLSWGFDIGTPNAPFFHFPVD